MPKGKDTRQLSCPMMAVNSPWLSCCLKSGPFEAFEEGLQAQRVGDIIKGLESTRVTLTMPQFEFDSDFSLKDTLAGMGMPVAFSGGADFSGMTGHRSCS